MLLSGCALLSYRVKRVRVHLRLHVNSLHSVVLSLPQVKGYRYLEEDNSDESESDSEKSDEEEEDEEHEGEEGGEIREDVGGDAGSQGSDSPRARMGGARDRRRQKDEGVGHEE